MFSTWYTDFPGLLAGIIATCTLAGSGMGAVVIYYAQRGNVKSMTEAHKATVYAIKESATAQAQTAAEQLAKCERERDANRQATHDVREDLGSRLTDATLRVKELELRPDMTALMEASKNMVHSMEILTTNVMEHDKKVSERLTPLFDGLAQTNDTLKKVANGITQLLKRTPKLRKQIA